MRLVKRQAKKTYNGKDGVERHYYNYYLESDNGKRVAIKPVNVSDFAKLDMISVYER